MGWLLYEVTREFSSSLEIDEVLGRVLSLTVSAIKAHVGSIFLLDADGKVVRSILARKDLPSEVRDSTIGAVMEKGFGGWVYKNTQADIISDTKEDSRWHVFPDDRLVTRSVIAAPLIRHDMTIGIITLSHPKPCHFGNRQLELLEAIAGAAAMAVENASLFKRVQDERSMLKRLDTQKNEFVSHMAHDLKSPLHVIFSYVELLHQFSGLNEEGKGFVKEIRTAIERMKSLISNILDINRIGMGIESEIVPVDLAFIVKDTIKNLQGLSREKGISLASGPGADLLPVNGSPVRLGQALINLAGNAIKFTPSGGAVIIQGAIEEGRVVIRVTDTGPGIPLELQHKLFQKFSKLNQKETRIQEGHGLGLAIVKSVIDAHKGEIWVESAPEKGSTFAFSLPLSMQ
jgi:signal transduction histidine kinase